MVCADLDLVIGHGRAFFRITDLIELENLVRQLSGGRRRKGAAQGVRLILPQVQDN